MRGPRDEWCTNLAQARSIGRYSMPTATPLALMAACGMTLAFAAGLGWGPFGWAGAPMPAMTPAACSPSARTFARLELLFGTTKKDGGLVSETEWLAFLQNEVTPRFPDGLTQFDVYGQWKRPDGAIAKLPSRMLLIWYVRTPDADARIDAVRSTFKQRFDQLSVMRIDGRDCVSF